MFGAKLNMSPSTIEYLHHILDAIRYLVEQSSSLTEDEFYGDPTHKRAFVRSLEIVGEAAKQLPPGDKRAVRRCRVACDHGDARPAHPPLFQC